MGVYSLDRHSMSGVNYAEDITANESYTCDCGIERMLFESEINDMAIFEAVIKNDMQITVGLTEGTILESELDYLNEAAGGSFFRRIVDLFKKLIEKVKGIIKSFIAKITMLCTRDNKKLVDKYKKEVTTKNFSKFKYKYRKRKGTEINAESVFGADLTKAFAKINSQVGMDDKYKEEIDKLMDDYTEDDALLSVLLKGTGPNADASEFDKEYMDYLFDDEDEYEDFGSYQQKIMKVLTEASETLKATKKTEEGLVRRMNDLINYFSKIANKNDKTGVDSVKFKNNDNAANSKANPSGYTYKSNAAVYNGNGTASMQNTGYNHDNVVYCANACYKVALIGQSAMTKALAAHMNGIKYEIKEARAVWSKAVTFNPKAVKESAELEDMVYESCMDEIV